MAILVSSIEVMYTFTVYSELKNEENSRTCAKSDQDAIKDVKLIVGRFHNNKGFTKL